MADATLLITGGAGFTGRHLIAAANQKGYRCIAMVQHEVPEAPAAFDTVVADLLDPASLEQEILKVKPD